MPDNILTPIDGLLTVLWLAVIVIIGIGYRNSIKKTDPRRKYLLPALLLKLASGVSVGLVYQFYYGGGDTTVYFSTATNLAYSALNYPDQFLNLYVFNSGLDNLPFHIETYYQYGLGFSYYNDPHAYFVTKVVSVFSFFGFLSYYPTAVLMAAFSFMGIWLLYTALLYHCPTAPGRLALAVFFIPSVFFWGSGILKDSLTLAMLGLFFYGVHSIFALRKSIILSFAVIFVSGYIVFRIKPYIIFSFLPFILFWISNLYRSRIGSSLAKTVFGPLLTILFLVSGLALILLLTSLLPQYSFENLISESNLKRTDLVSAYYYADGIGSSYDIGDVEPTLGGAISKAPISIWTTFFRPYPWEVRSPVVAFASVESLALLILTFYILFQVGLVSFLRIAFQYPLVTFMLLFSLFFAFFCGFTSGNFGNLVRYKIPCMPFFVASLFIVQTISELERRVKPSPTVSSAKPLSGINA